MVAVAGGKFQRAHGMSFCGGSAKLAAFREVTGLIAANAPAVGGALADAPATRIVVAVAAARTHKAIPLLQRRRLCESGPTAERLDSSNIWPPPVAFRVLSGVTVGIASPAGPATRWTIRCAWLRNEWLLTGAPM